MFAHEVTCARALLTLVPVLSKVLRAGLPMPALADCRQLADSNDHYNDTDTFISFTSSKLVTQNRHSNGVGASGEDKKKQKKKKLHEEGSRRLRSGDSSSSRSSRNTVNGNGGGRGSKMNGGSRSGGGSSKSGSSRSGKLPKSCGAALANAASQAHAKKHHPCPNHQLSCSAVKAFNFLLRT